MIGTVDGPNLVSHEMAGASAIDRPCRAAARPEPTVLGSANQEPLAETFGRHPAPFDGETRPLEHRMQNAGRQWADIAGRYQLKEPGIDRLVSWWHTDADLRRPMVVNPLLYPD